MHDHQTLRPRMFGVRRGRNGYAQRWKVLDFIGFYNVPWKGEKNAKTITWAAFGGMQGVQKEELSRVASQIYLRKRAGCTHVAFREKAKCTIETFERTRNDLTAHT